MTASLTSTQPTIIGGIDAHKDTHHAVVLDDRGVRLADQGFPATTAGYRCLLDWMTGFGRLDRVGIESTGSYAAGLTRFLQEHGTEVIEVNQPHPHTRARRGKDDAIDAEAAARKALSGEASTRPKTTTGVIESIRLLRIARESAVRARTTALVQLQDVLITAPAELREQITATSGRSMATQCARLRPDASRLAEPAQAAKLALRTLARRVDELEAEITEIDDHLGALVRHAAPTLTSRLGIGTIHASQLLVTAGQNIDRLTSEAAFARLCGVAPIPVSSGKTHRMRLHRGGDRQANRALHLIAVCRLRYDQRTRDYAARRLAEGLSKKDILRCLKRFIAREVYNDLRHDLTALDDL
ncbi:IS110 family transposase [Kocuria rosea]|uniref:IS110 family transposase n=1 Tax=Kocuria rosea TaxID=1275 RepID=UPI000D65A0C3|nr:IS110 family transposase [Kocuria rosea]PWF81990.1 IS110 family transposase [Kocuria rosea]QCY33585.1 IS110 family transposase [Kocuria rosea]TQN35831.1 transposase [Kocuria rosea]